MGNQGRSKNISELQEKKKTGYWMFSLPNLYSKILRFTLNSNKKRLQQNTRRQRCHTNAKLAMIDARSRSKST